MGSCFYRARETHVSLGIMNVHPIYFGRGVGRKLLGFITDFADRQGLLRLISSAMNLNSFSLYTRTGFVPCSSYQDMIPSVPEERARQRRARSRRVRVATRRRRAIAALELELPGISRAKDYRHFIENQNDLWHLSVIESPAGELDGYLASIGHPSFTMLGARNARTDADGLALLAAELDGYRGRTALYLVPVDRGGDDSRVVRVGWAEQRAARPPVARRLRALQGRQLPDVHAGDRLTTLVTGATGFLGRHLLSLLAERGDPLRALVREGTDDSFLRGLDVEVVRGDILDGAGFELRLPVAGASFISRASWDTRSRCGRSSSGSTWKEFARCSQPSSLGHGSCTSRASPRSGPSILPRCGLTKTIATPRVPIGRSTR